MILDNGNRLRVSPKAGNQRSVWRSFFHLDPNPMAWLGTQNPRVEVHRTLIRILNTSCACEWGAAEADRRQDSRVPRTTPVVILPLVADHQDAGPTLGLTKDMSCEGMAVTTLGTLPVDANLAVGIGGNTDFSVMLCRCVHCQPIGYGFYESGVHVREMLDANDFVPLKNYAHYLENELPKFDPSTHSITGT